MQLKWAILVVATCVVVTVAAVAYGAGKASDVPEVIRAQRFEVVDASGRVWAALASPDQDGTRGLFVYDGDTGRERVRLVAYRAGSPQLILTEPGWPRGAKASVGLQLAEGRPVLMFWGWREDGRPHAGLLLGPEGSLGLSLSDGDGRERARLDVGGNGVPRLQMWDAHGVGGPHSHTAASHTPRVLVGLDEEGEAGLKLFDVDGEVIWEAP